jgi:hypothetical protein
MLNLWPGEDGWRQWTDGGPLGEFVYLERRRRSSYAMLGPNEEDARLRLSNLAASCTVDYKSFQGRRSSGDVVECIGGER